MTGTELAELRTHLGLTQQTLADKADVSRTWLAQLETLEGGQAELRPNVARRLLRALDTLGYDQEERVLAARAKIATHRACRAHEGGE